MNMHDQYTNTHGGDGDKPKPFNSDRLNPPGFSQDNLIPQQRHVCIRTQSSGRERWRLLRNNLGKLKEQLRL
ncbi:hypothetical protein H4219_005285, partial [Mycoemilia scoparia]